MRDGCRFRPHATESSLVGAVGVAAVGAVGVCAVRAVSVAGNLRWQAVVRRLFVDVVVGDAHGRTLFPIVRPPERERPVRKNVEVASCESNQRGRGGSDIAAGSTDPVGRARSISNAEQAAALYAEWAPTYDADVFGDLGFTGSARIAELLVSVLPDPTLPVIDLGCGTGAVGRRLAQLGITTIDGVDLSPEMLAVASSSGAYRRLTVADLHALEDQPCASYAASVSAGTFTSGHVRPEVVPRLVDLLRPEGIVSWVIGTAVWPQFEQVLATYELAVLHRSIEAIRRDGPPEAVMFVARMTGRLRSVPAG